MSDRIAASVRTSLAEIRAELGDTYFAWHGNADGSGRIYYRTQGPTLIIEFATQSRLGGDGMVSVIAEYRPGKYLSIKHIGIVNHGIDDTDSDEVEAWPPAYENYTLTEIDGGTELRVEMDVPPEYADYFSKTWPKALEAIRRLAEASVG